MADVTQLLDAGEKPGQTLQPTALVHEAYLRLVGGVRRGSSPPNWTGRGTPRVDAFDGVFVGGAGAGILQPLGRLTLPGAAAGVHSPA
jgi:hypothetical protein